jgi:putative transposase
MARSLRLQFPDAVYHVTSRGDRRENIFEDDYDRQAFLAVVAQALERFSAMALAYCLMDNHYHLVIYTRLANLSALMRHINGIVTQSHNRRHGKVGHLFQGRFKAIVVDQDNYLLEVCRYVDLNPVRAGLVGSPGEWAWSSYRSHAGITPPPPWLDTAGLHARLLQQPISSAADSRRAQRLYVQTVSAARDVRLWDEALSQQVYLGDDAFVQRMQGVVAHTKSSQPAMTLLDWMQACDTREEAMRGAHVHSGMTMTAIAHEVGLTVARVSQLIGQAEQKASKAI